MNQWIVLAALITSLALCALVVGFCAFFSAHRASHRARQAAETAREECAGLVSGLQSRIETITAEMHDALRRPAVEPLPGVPKSSMNLTKRSQALRLRRQGDSPQQIAEALAIPRQEVDLLIKVHELALNNL